MRLDKPKKQSLYYTLSILSALDILLSILIIVWLLFAFNFTFQTPFQYAAIIIIVANLMVVITLYFMLHKKVFAPLKSMLEMLDPIDLSNQQDPQNEMQIIEDKIKHTLELLNKRNISHDKFEIKRKALISSITHDLRMPLTSITGYAEALYDGIATEENKKKYLETILESAKHLNRLIDDLDVYSKNDLGELQIYKRKLLSSPLMDDYFKDVYMDKEINLILNRPFTNTLIDVDPVRFRQILDNLISNAIKHTQKEIIVSTRIKEDHLVIEIKNDGDQIPEELKDKIFDPFYMISKNRNTEKDSNSSGLGLAIVKQLMEAHGGKVNYFPDNQNKYTTFTIEFPIINI